jgi:hypothetical protein
MYGSGFESLQGQDLFFFIENVQTGPGAHPTCIQWVQDLLSGTAVAQWLRYCATNRKVAGSIPDGVIA